VRGAGLGHPLALVKGCDFVGLPLGDCRNGVHFGIVPRSLLACTICPGTDRALAGDLTWTIWNPLIQRLPSTRRPPGELLWGLGRPARSAPRIGVRPGAIGPRDRRCDAAADSRCRSRPRLDDLLRGTFTYGAMYGGFFSTDLDPRNTPGRRPGHGVTGHGRATRMAKEQASAGARAGHGRAIGIRS